MPYSVNGERIKEPFAVMYKGIEDNLKRLGFEGKLPPELCYSLFARQAYVDNNADENDRFENAYNIDEENIVFEAKYEREDTLAGKPFYTLHICKIIYNGRSLEVKIEVPCMYEGF